MKKLRYIFLGIMMMFGLWHMQVIDASAANNVTITVDASDDNDGLLYAIDSTDPDAFSDSGSFSVLSGSTHTIYVKDVAGNITSQTYVVPDTETDAKEAEKPVITTNVEESYSDKDRERQINIDVDLSNNGSQYSSASASAEDGGGTLYEKENQTSDDSGKIFYTVTTREGEVFYLIIDQNQGEDNVYLLSQVTVSELQSLADSNGYDFNTSGSVQKSNSLLDALSVSGSGDKTSSADVITDSEASSAGNTVAQNNIKNILLILFVAVFAGGAYYILRIRKNKQNAQMDEIDEANDLKDYEIDDDQDEVKFEESDDEKEVNSMSGDDFLMNLDTESAFGDEGFEGFDESDDEQEEF